MRYHSRFSSTTSGHTAEATSLWPTWLAMTVDMVAIESATLAATTCYVLGKFLLRTAPAIASFKRRASWHERKR